MEASFELLVPLVVASIIDVGIAGGNRSHIIKCGLILVALALIGLSCAVTAQFFCAKAAAVFGTKLRQALFEHIQKLSPAVHERIGSATLITRLTSDVIQAQTGVNKVLRLFLRSPFIVIGAAVMAFTVDVEASLVFVVLLVLLSLVVGALLKITIPLFVRIQASLDVVLKRVRENLGGVRVLRAFRREEAEQQAFVAESGRLMQLQIFTGRITGLLNPLTLVIVNLCIIVLLWQGALRVSTGILTQGAVVALVNYMSQILIELIKLANLIVTVTRALASGERLAEVLELPVGEKISVSTSGLLRSARNDDNLPYLAFTNVSFRYPGATEDALRDISFSVNKGETIGIVGGTGAGKTSLVHLLTRFYDLTGGSISWDGHDLSQLPPEVARAQIGIAMQKAVLVKGTIRNNLRWGKEDATDEEMWEALRIAAADDFVRAKEGQLDAMIEQEGRNLSGGQKQRLSIARALLRQAPLLILDDSASELDYLTEAFLRKELAKLAWPTATFIISQRAGSVRYADQILVLDDGKLVGCGKHEDLMKECEVYCEIMGATA
jgi:ABC-type multidrug transport system fused ATPase/permease subunit